jgi:phenylacetate-CoA ligase
MLKDFMETASSRTTLEQRQLQRLRQMLRRFAGDEFYRKKFSAHALGRSNPWRPQGLPLTTKGELVEDQTRHPPFGTDLTFPPNRYIRIHQTSGTTGKPMYWLDTEDSWEWWAECWKVILEAAGIHPEDRIYFAFSFGPFIGFWAGWEGARKLGAMAVSGGGQSTLQRLKAIIDYGDGAYLHSDVRVAHGIRGEKGSGSRVRYQDYPPCRRARGSIRAQKDDSRVLGAKCFDHPGATEVGAFGFSANLNREGPRQRNEFIAELLDPNTGEAVTKEKKEN